jgi:hypothetical protein
MDKLKLDYLDSGLSREGRPNMRSRSLVAVSRVAALSRELV